MQERDVHIDCGKARSRASELRRQAEDLRAVISEYQSVSGELSVLWQGKSALRFKESIDQRIKDLSRAASNTEQIAVAIEQTADVYETKQVAQIRRDAADAAARASGAAQAGSSAAGQSSQRSPRGRSGGSISGGGSGGGSLGSW
ncbi:MAG: WXG100 family type VII secretion target [Atopobiaceae bacterium]|nr:WXG100 family type VII secretion target [Atopobiaceae bacterium]